VRTRKALWNSSKQIGTGLDTPPKCIQAGNR
jgi:hypothetical protein